MGHKSVGLFLGNRVTWIENHEVSNPNAPKKEKKLKEVDVAFFKTKSWSFFWDPFFVALTKLQ